MPLATKVQMYGRYGLHFWLEISVLVQLIIFRVITHIFTFDSGISVLQTVVFCLVDIYIVLGKAFLPYLGSLSSTQLRLVTIYANRISQVLGITFIWLDFFFSWLMSIYARASRLDLEDHWTHQR